MNGVTGQHRGAGALRLLLPCPSSSLCHFLSVVGILMPHLVTDLRAGPEWSCLISGIAHMLASGCAVSHFVGGNASSVGLCRICLHPSGLQRDSSESSSSSGQCVELASLWCSGPVGVHHRIRGVGVSMCGCCDQLCSLSLSGQAP